MADKTSSADATLVVLGNGPSLKGFDFARLKAFDCIGMNAAYRYWREIGWYPRFYACLDLVVGLSHKDAIVDLIRTSAKNGIELFFLRHNLIDALPKDLRRSPMVIDFDRLRPLDGFAVKPATTGSHAALIGAQLGYRTLVLLGADCNYVERVGGAKEKTEKIDGAKAARGVVLEMAEAPKDNPNYFFAGYQVAGDKYIQPSADLHVESWRVVAPFLKKRGVTVWNASPVSRVDAFPFRPFDAIEAEHRKRGNRPRTLMVDTRLLKAVKARALALFRVGQVAPWPLRAARRRPYAAIAVLLAVAALAAAPAYPPLWPYRDLFWVVAGALALVGAATPGATAFEALRRLRALLKSQRAELEARVRAVQQASDRRAAALEVRVASLTKDVEGLSSRQAKADADMGDVRETLTQGISSSSGRLDALTKHVEGLSLRADKAAAVEARTTGLTEKVQQLHKDLENARAAIEKLAERMDKALGKDIDSVKSVVATLQSQAVSLDIASALRALRPLWLGGSAVETLKQQPEVEHGHALLMAVLADEERALPGTLSGKVLIEIGTTRERDPGQSSTEKLAIFTAMTGMRFVTVDMDPLNTERGKRVLRYLNPAAQAITEKGEDYLAAHAGPLEYVYLDAFDFDHDKHSQERQARYREILHTKISDEACWQMHKQCAEAIIARMPNGGIVTVDDTWTDAEGNYAGKGKLALPLLLENGFEIVARTRMAIALKRIQESQESLKGTERRGTVRKRKGNVAGQEESTRG